MTRSSLLALLVPAMLVTGCAGTQNRGLESVHQPVVSRSEYAFDVATTNGRLAAGETQRLNQWLASMRLAYGDQVSVDAAPADLLFSRDEVAGLINRYGLLLSNGAPVMAAPVTPGTVRVVISRMTARVPGCPDFSRAAEPNFDNHTSSNYGCATNSNLAAMVARPEDLLHGQGTNGGIDPAVSGKAIETFRKAQNTGAGALKIETTSSATGG